MRALISFCLITATLFISHPIKPSRAGAPEGDAFDWRSNWALEEGFSLAVDTDGYQFPTAIAFVPNPGDDPKDPLYFVTELRGQIKVVTNDRSVFTFAKDFFALEPKEELPSSQGEIGLAGICLEPKRGYVFVTFAYQDEGKTLRNNVVRFQSTPGSFSRKPTAQTAFTDIFLPYPTGIAHQIGSCEVHDDLLFIGIGEAWQPFESQQLDSLYGKIVRMTLDGEPVPDNPFFQNTDRNLAANYIWAYGLRNPFSLKILDGSVFAADNGPNIDRFLEIEKGQNYLWNGDQNSIATNAAYVFIPSVGPVQMDFYSGSSSLFPQQYDQQFFLAASAYERNGDKSPGVLSVNYSLGEHRMLAVPQYLVKYRGKQHQMVTGLAFGPDGLYFTPLYPDKEGSNPVLKVSYAPEQAYPYTLLTTIDPLSFIKEKGCFGCHIVGARHANAGTVGPRLDGDLLVERLEKRLNSDEYTRQLAEIDALTSEPHRSYKAARAEVMNATGIEKIRSWVKYRIHEPRFDMQYSQMPNLGLSDKEAQMIADYLLRDYIDTSEAGRSTFNLKQRITRLLPGRIKNKHLFMAAAGGFVLATVSIMVLLFLKRRLSR